MSGKHTEMSREYNEADQPAPEPSAAPLTADDRAVSNLVGFAVNLGTASLVFILFIPIVYGVVSSSNYETATPQASESAQYVSSGIQTVDRLTRSSESPGVISQEVSLPNQYARQPYTIEVLNSSDAANSDLCGSSGQVGDNENTGCIITRIKGGPLDDPRPVVSFFRTSEQMTVESTSMSGGSVRVIRRPGSPNAITIEQT